MSVWGPLAERYEGKEDEPHRMLALDGGGIRGVLTLEVLARMEELLREARGAGPEFRLCDFFDYIGGTSTGAIIAAGLARGMSANELLEFYEDKGSAMFEKRGLLKRYYSLYKSDPLQAELQNTFGADTTLHPEHLRCMLLVVTRNRSTDSPWPISSNPQAKYNALERQNCNLQIPLWQLVRASTAAPIFFPPEVLQWDPTNDDNTFVFVNGGVTPYNSPAFLMYRMATQAGYRLGWSAGEDRLLIMSLGTGAAPVEEDAFADVNPGAIGNVAGIPGALMYGAMIDQDTNCRTVGRCVHGATLDREIGDMIPRDEAGQRIPLSEDLGRKFLYARYDAELSREGLDEMGFPDLDPEKVSKLDSIAAIPDLRRIGRKIGEEIELAHFGPFI